LAASGAQLKQSRDRAQAAQAQLIEHLKAPVQNPEELRVTRAVIRRK
jgi:hypothetical protein